ncbi:MAG: hypothetical protein ACKVE4_05730 [Dissulfuribacterales bacterium]
MSFLKNITAIICMVFLMSLSTPAFPGHAQKSATGGLDADRVFWKSLCFKAGNFFVSLRSDVYFEIFAAKEIEEKLIPTPEVTAL